jgi:hypothetical protein
MTSMEEQLHWKDIGVIPSEKEKLGILLRKKRNKGEKKLTTEEEDKLASYILTLNNTGKPVSQEERTFMLEVRARQTQEDHNAENHSHGR